MSVSDEQGHCVSRVAMSYPFRSSPEERYGCWSMVVAVRGYKSGGGKVCRRRLQLCEVCLGDSLWVIDGGKIGLQLEASLLLLMRNWLGKVLIHIHDKGRCGSLSSVRSSTKAII